MIQLEVGKTYEVRDPKTVTKEYSSAWVKILSVKENGFFQGSDLFTYHKDGRCPMLLDTENNPYDLVKEIEL